MAGTQVIRQAPIDLSTRRCEEAFELVARSRTENINRPLLEATLQMLGLRLTSDEVSALQKRRAGSGEEDAPHDDVNDLVDLLGIIDTLRQGGAELPKVPPHTTRYMGKQPWARVDPTLLLPGARVNGKRLRTMAAGGAPGSSSVAAHDLDMSRSALDADAVGIQGPKVEPIPQLRELSADERTRLHVQSLLHTFANKPPNAGRALIRIYLLSVYGSLCVVGSVVLGRNSAPCSDMRLYLLVQGCLVLTGAATHLVSAAVAANRNPLQLMRMPLEASTLEFVLDGVRLGLLLPVLAIWLLFGAVWTVSPGSLGFTACRMEAYEAWLAACASIVASLVLALAWVAAVIWRSASARALRKRAAQRTAAATGDSEPLNVDKGLTPAPRSPPPVGVEVEQADATGP